MAETPQRPVVTTKQDLAVLGGRTVLGGYLAVHGAQKLFGSFEGPGRQAIAAAFDHLGLRPGRVMGAMAGLSELGGGLLTLAGAAHPVGPIALTGTMAVASLTHRANGPLAQKGGFELPLTNLGAALVLTAIGPGRYSIDGLLGRRLPRPLVGLAALFAIAATGQAVSQLLRAKPEPAPDDTDTSPDDETGAASSQVTS
jgi:putative oxidoreductase